MISIAPILFEQFELLKQELIAKYDEKGMRASGQFSEELENVSRDNVGELKGMDYTQQLELGRRGGTMPPINAIEKWIVDKGIMRNVEENITVTSLAWAIAKKIKREGWNREGFGGVNLISEVITDERIDAIVEACGNFYTKEFVSEILVLLNDDKLFNSVA